ncbi:hypothetical protein GCM10022222_70580 [Amycolatopsis ultiminotia]|uniref:Uncharacterized protein n=1 Tax=Amycolatopsis ultiminotia TaxID=543629 RepID=A0ABP6Y145_9PSEU
MDGTGAKRVLTSIKTIAQEGSAARLDLGLPMNGLGFAPQVTSTRQGNHCVGTNSAASGVVFQRTIPGRATARISGPPTVRGRRDPPAG